MYEHMFCSSRKPEAPQRLVRTLRLVRSFLLLEDDYDVDWEVDQDERAFSTGSVREWSAGRGEGRPDGGLDSHLDEQRDLRLGDHPHRMALRSRLGDRRPGVVASGEQVCLCPVGGRARAGVSRGSSSPERSCADSPRGVGSSRNP